MHRLTGIALSFGLMLFVLWLALVARGPDAYDHWVPMVSACWLSTLILMGVTFALFFHLCCGIRHLMWDSGAGMDMPSVTRSGLLTIATAVILTVLTWLHIYGVIL